MKKLFSYICRDNTDLPYVGVYKIMNHPAILVRDLEIIKDIMSTNFASFYNNDFVVNPELDPLISNNPFAAVGENWKMARTTMAPLFTAAKVFICINFTTARTMI